MAVEQGTATSFADFFNKLRDFLTTNADLVADGQEWTQIYGDTGTLNLDDDIVLQGPGLAGDDEIRIRLSTDYSFVGNRYNLLIRGYPNWNPALAAADQFNFSAAVCMHLWDSSMPYVFVANGRRFIAIAQVTSVVEAGYGGLFLPYALPDEYPLPLCVGGTSNQTSWLYSQASVAHCHFVNPSNSLKVYHPSNVWLNVINFVQGTGNSYQWQVPGSLVLPYNSSGNDSAYRSNWADVRECFGGQYPLHPLIIIDSSLANSRLGVLDGCYHVPGIGNAHGSLLDVDGPGSHMVIQNVSRTDTWLGYWALKLE